jgi:hypothetical protein
MEETPMNPLAPSTSASSNEGHPLADVPALVERTSELLRTGVPLTLLLDLAEEAGPRSAQHYASEGGDVSWVRRQS